MYKASVNKSFDIWNTIYQDQELRKTLNNNCHNTFAVLQDGFGYFKCPLYKKANDEIKHVLSGTRKQNWQEDTEFAELAGIPVQLWKK